MDDIKLFAQDDNEFKDILNTIKKVSRDAIGIDIGLDKCAK